MTEGSKTGSVRSLYEEIRTKTITLRKKNLPEHESPRSTSEANSPPISAGYKKAIDVLALPD
jgi:hypothetical protein